MKKKIVVALGRKALGDNLPEQKEAVRKTAKALADLIEDGNQLIITHSNGAQVGMIDSAIRDLSRKDSKYTVAPIAVCDAMSQGYIGYDLQNAIRAELVARGLYVPICTIITQARVDAYDDAFFNPTKSIGQPMEKEQADEEVKKGHTMKETPEGFYKMVASPEPLEIVELDSIRALADAGHIVIACGGGGIPVIEQNQHLKGASAVIEKDIAAAKLAKDLDADVFMILTNVDKVCLHYQKENETALDELSIQDAANQIEAGQFEEGTMLPKIQAAIAFSGAKEGRQTIISSLDKAVSALHGKTGTVIRK